MNEYLWDRSGPPDPEVARLENALAPLRLQSYRAPRPERSAIPWSAIAACVLMAVAAWQLLPADSDRESSWVMADSGRQIYAGERIRVTSPVALAAERFGRIELQPDSELEVVESGSSRQRMRLQQGRLHAIIWSPPGQFVVDTPSARAVDLGCQYDLSVDANGNGFLRVESGWVAFQAGGIESFIPAGAACHTTKMRGPGLPYFESASPEFRRALERFEQSGAGALAALLALAGPEDALTLWHLLGRGDAAQRGAVFDRFAELVRLPSGVTRERVVARDRAALDLCWNALGFADASWWREWEAQWR
jgi:hypothetical protein